MFRPRAFGLLLALATLLAYLPATSNNFINYDDQAYVYENQVVQSGLTWAGVKWAFMGVHACNWHPLTWLSHMVDCDLFRLNPGGPHLVNILFHAVNAALLFTLLWRLTEKLWPSAFVAALFAWHPLHVESVAWISERKDVLSTFFTLLTLLCYARYAKEVTGDGNQAAGSRRSPFFWLALFFFVLALLSKPMPVTLPLVMLFLDYWPLRRMDFGKWRGAGVLRLALEKWPFFLLTAGSCVVTVLAQHKTVSSLARVPFSFRLENTATAYVGYLWKMVWPQDLAIFYPLHAPIAWQWVAEAVIILAGISVIVWRERKGSPWLLVGWLWFLVTLVPVIGLVQVGSQAMADRYTYFPLVGIFLALAFSAQALAGRFAWLKPWLASAGVLVLGACLVLTEKQLRYWSDSKTLFTHTLAVTESDMAHICVGSALQDQNRKSEAMTQYLMALQLNPLSALACSDLANLLYEEGKPEMARYYCEAAVQRDPKSPNTHINLGIVLGEMGRYDEALKEFSTATQTDPIAAQPHYLTGKLLLQLGRDAEALTQLRAALKLDPADGQTLVFTASVLAAAENPRVRDGAEARVLADKVVRLTHGQQPAALDAQAMACAETGRFDEAVQIQQQAVKLMAATGSKADVAVMQKRLQLYQQHQPWRESFKKN